MRVCLRVLQPDVLQQRALRPVGLPALALGAPELPLDVPRAPADAFLVLVLLDVLLPLLRLADQPHDDLLLLERGGQLGHDDRVQVGQFDDFCLVKANAFCLRRFGFARLFDFDFCFDLCRRADFWLHQLLV